MQPLKAIETRYKGYRFRSRLEARWSVFFDALGIEWAYEAEGYTFSIDWYDNCDLPSGPFCYLPDFWLPQVGMFAEVKPEKPTDEELAKAIGLADQTGRNVLFLIGMPAATTYFAISGSDFNHGAWDLTLEEYDIQEGHRYWLYENRFYWENRESFEVDGFVFPEPSRVDGNSRAINAAKSARFEHGEKP